METITKYFLWLKRNEIYEINPWGNEPHNPDGMSGLCYQQGGTFYPAKFTFDTLDDAKKARDIANEALA
jgi:hypothetical protein